MRFCFALQSEFCEEKNCRLPVFLWGCTKLVRLSLCLYIVAAATADVVVVSGHLNGNGNVFFFF